MKAACFLSLLVGLASASLAQAQTHGPAPATPCACTAVSGYVTDGSQPLAGVTVMVQGTRQLTITNGDGYFTMPLESAGPSKLVFEAAGYEPQALTTTSCHPIQMELGLLPGTRIKQRGKHKGYIVKAGEHEVAAN